MQPRQLNRDTSNKPSGYYRPSRDTLMIVNKQCPLCGLVAETAYIAGDTGIPTYKHKRMVKGIYKTKYCEVK